MAKFTADEQYASDRTESMDRLFDDYTTLRNALWWTLSAIDEWAEYHLIPDCGEVPEEIRHLVADMKPRWLPLDTKARRSE